MGKSGIILGPWGLENKIVWLEVDIDKWMTMIYSEFGLYRWQIIDCTRVKLINGLPIFSPHYSLFCIISIIEIDLPPLFLLPYKKVSGSVNNLSINTVFIDEKACS